MLVKSGYSRLCPLILHSNGLMKGEAMQSVRPARLGLVGLALLLPAAARAQATYKIQPIVKTGDTLAGVPVRLPLVPGVLNDKGQLAFHAISGTGAALFRFADGTFTPLVAGGQDAPGGVFPRDVFPSPNPSMNQRSNVVFQANVTVRGTTTNATFLWDAQTQKLTTIAFHGMPAVNNLTFLANDGPQLIPAINNQDEIVFGGYVADTAGNPELTPFFLDRNRTLRAVALFGQELPGGGTLLQQAGMAVTDAGVVAFRARRPGDPTNAFSAYQWENGVLTPLALVGGGAPGGGTITRVSALRLNNRDRSVLLVLRVSTTPNQAGLYRLSEGQLKAVAVPGQEMPEGGKLATVLEESQSAFGPNAGGDVSQANEAGQHLFHARLEDGIRALYRLDPDGKLALLLKQGSVTDLGAITRLVGGQGIGFNSRGQIALTAKIAGGPETLYLLTPTTP
jgi:hypothetical protein